MTSPRGHVTYANVVATLALFIALGGSAYAAVKVTGRNVVDGSLTGKDVKNESLRSADIKGLKAKDFAAGQLPVGTNGTNGTNGANGANGTNGAPGATGPVGPAGPGAAAHGPDAGQNVNNNALPLADLSVEEYDTGGLYAAPGDEMVVGLTGKYLVTATTSWGNNSTGTRDLGIVLDGDTGAPIARDLRQAEGATPQQLSTIMDLAAGNTIGLRVNQTSGVNLLMTRPRLAMQWIGP